MTQIVSLTSEGQISIPAKMLAKFGKNRPTKVIVRAVDNGWFVEPVPDILSLGGSLHKYAIKGKSADQIRKMEREAFEEAVVEDYLASVTDD
jgi:bifunctional DNA-binding transcriptional regulator/antitoxin component of YhaV-PrlF toxin-antitoxin module